MAIIRVPVHKLGVSVEVDPENVPMPTYQEALYVGFQMLASRGQAKAQGDFEKGQEILRRQLEKIKAGTVRESWRKKEKLYPLMGGGEKEA